MGTIRIVESMTGKKLTEIRDQLQWTQVQLGEAIGVTGNTVSRWECGGMKISEPVARLILRIQAEQKPKPKTKRR